MRSGMIFPSLSLTFALVCGCGSPPEMSDAETSWELSYLSRGVAARSIEGRSALRFEGFQVLQGERVNLPDSIRAFVMRTPAAVAASPDGCTAIVSDYADDAVHMFARSLGGLAYSGTLSGGITDTSFVRGAGAVAVGEGDLMAVTSFAARKITVLRGGTPEWTSSIDTDYWEAGWSHGELALVGDSIVIDHWFRASALLSEPVDWAREDLPLVRVHTQDRVHEFGRLSPADRLMAPFLSRGRLVSDGDGFWFGRSADAVLLEYIVRSPSRIHVRDSLRLPLAFPSLDAVQGHRATGEPSGLVGTDHLLDFDRTDRGFIVLQATGYPDIRSQADSSWGPTGAVVVHYDDTGESIAGYRIDVSNPRQLAMVGSIALVLADDSDDRPAVFAFDLPHLQVPCPQGGR